MEPSSPAPQSQPSYQPVTPPSSSPQSSQPGTAGQPTRSNGLAIASLVIGIISFLFGWAGVFILLPAIAAVVLGIIALKKKQSKGLALTGTILGALGLLTAIIATALAASLLGQAAKDAAQDLPANTESSQSTSPSGTEEAWDMETAYEKIQNGMTKAQVEEATGRTSDNCSETTTEFTGKLETCNYGTSNDKGTITVTFTKDAVSSKSKFNY